ncbi:caspase-10 [Sarcophilus harrisii]|uniref:Caspase 10 n=1 Tax=Sarcophilus harrisii TaxID=9305 RepID=A0A7N4V6N5_SARHA|nr:caspase-10 [Sarcophilus harrisii]XP_012401780.1 caspase-10 [Sarcophilus harrisii]
MPRSCINMEDDNNLEFCQKLLFINENLGHDDVEALKFLCSDLISLKNLESIDSAYKLFEKLMCEDLLNKENCFLVAELLFLIKQQYLLHQIGYTKEKVQKERSTKRIISSYRIMLYNLAEEITTEDFDHIKFLLKKDIPKTVKSFLSLLRYLEKQELLSENNLEILENVFKSLSKSLMKRINQYKTEKEEEKLSVASGLDECLWKTSLQENPEEATQYEMTSKHRGLCIIFNNFKFKTMNFRKGSCKDEGELKSVFEWLGFTVTAHKNKTKEEMENILRLCRNDPKHQESDCFVCCILTHGDSGCVFSSDEKSIAIKEILNYFTAKQCPGLINKPKLFFVQACQGKDEQKGVLLEADARSVNNSLSVPKNIPQMYIPTEADFLLGMATVDGCFAVRHIEKGSWYIQALCHLLKRLVPREEDILTILTIVNNDVSKQAIDEKGEMKQMPQPAFTLRKKVIFPVPSDVSLL